MLQFPFLNKYNQKFESESRASWIIVFPFQRTGRLEGEKYVCVKGEFQQTKSFNKSSSTAAVVYFCIRHQFMGQI